MRTLLSTAAASVALFLLVGPLLVQSQAPAGAGPAGPAGPDAAIAALVDTACTSCHTLDRVNNKKADIEGWTATVTRMQASGANLTNQQVPLVVEYLVRNAGTLAITTLDGVAKGKGGGAPGGKGGGGKGGGKGGKGGGGGGGKNLQVLTQANSLPDTMQSFVQALGLLDDGACSYCHVEDRSSDEKIQKVIARRMITMVRAINGTFPDGQQHVTCYTCHRGDTKPPATP